MSLFVNCGWHPPAGTGIQTRIDQMARLLQREETVALVGGNWYRKGYSKKEALSKPLSLAKLGEVRSWTRDRFVYEDPRREEIDYSIDAWNGRDPPESASLSITLYETPPTETDSLVFGGPGLETLKDKWHEVLAWSEAIANQLRGLSVVSSSDLIQWAEAEGLKRATSAAYAAFDGRARRSSVSAATWQEALTPNKKRVQEVIEMIEASVPG